MARQEDGWPLGLQPLNARVGLARNREQSGSISFTTLLTQSTSSSTVSSSDLDTESTESFFRDRSITLGNLIGISSILEVSRRSIRTRAAEVSRDTRTNTKSKPWFFSLCSKLSSDPVMIEDHSNHHSTPPLGAFPEAEGSASNDTLIRSNSESTDVNTVLASGQTGSQSIVPSVKKPDTKSKRVLIKHDTAGYGYALLLSCLRGQLID